MATPHTMDKECAALRHSKGIFLRRVVKSIGHTMSGVTRSDTRPVIPVTCVHRSRMSPARPHRSMCQNECEITSKPTNLPAKVWMRCMPFSGRNSEMYVRCNAPRRLWAWFGGRVEVGSQSGSGAGSGTLLLPPHLTPTSTMTHPDLTLSPSRGRGACTEGSRSTRCSVPG
eukprot:scaffold86808_cov69-Phaeocystis_antarctica.AAC.1